MDDLQIRPDRPMDADAIRRVIVAAFGQEAPAHAAQVADLWADVVASGFVRSSLVACLRERIVGHVGSATPGSMPAGRSSTSPS